MSKPADNLNSRQRLFCINLASGMSQTQAYINAGYSNVEAGANAVTLLKENQSVKAYYNQLLERKQQLMLDTSVEIVSKALTRDEKRNILAEIARAQLSDFQDDNGEPVLNKDTPQGRAAREFYHRRWKRTDGGEIVTKSIKLLSPIEAIQEDNKMAGHYAPRKHLVASYNVSVSLKPKNRHINEDDEG